MFLRRVVPGVIVLLACAGLGRADDQADNPAPPVRNMVYGPPGQLLGPEGGHFLEVKELFAGKVVTGAPYSAQVTTETVQTLHDGNRISQKTTTTVFRDSQGRTRREGTLGAVFPFLAGHGSQKVFINDPVAGTHFVLSPDKKEALRFPSLSGLANSFGGPGHHHPAGAKGDRPGKPERQTENLGKQTIGGVEAEGTRTTLTLPAGAVGNDSPIEIVSEKWYSPALQAVILRKHSDPRFGDTTTTWSDIKTAEPDHALFVVPSDYTTKDAPVFHKNLNPSTQAPSN